MNFSAEKELRFLLMHMDEYIDSFIYEILHDSEEEPEKSAVALNNVIKCFIKVENEMGIHRGYSNVAEYLAHACYTPEEIELIEKRRAKEAVYYRSEQF